MLHIKSPYIKRTMTRRLVAHSHSCLHSPNQDACSCPPIDLVDTQSYLGLKIDSKFKWHNHVEYVCNKLRQFLANIIILKNRIPFKIKLMLYNSLAESYIQYGLGSYGRTYDSYLNKIYNLQKRILKNVVSDKTRRQFEHDDNGLFNHCNILPVHIQVKYLLLKKYFFNDNFNQIINHPVCTRAVSDRRLVTSSASNVYGQRSTRYIVPRLINNLPTDLRDNLNEINLKRKLKRYFIDSLIK
jgi:hypothetical protein